MKDIIDTLKSHARILHRQADANEASAIRRLSRLGELQRFSAAELSHKLKRRHCLAVIAKELDFEGWPHITRTINGDEVDNFGTLLYPHFCGAHTNIWCNTYEEAKAIHGEVGGYLLAYRQQFLIVEEPYIVTMGLDPEDEDWQLIGRDWIRPVDFEARKRLYDKLIVHTLKQRPVKN